MTGDRYRHIRALYGEEGLAALAKAKILIVGAGGIGCEILKNIAFSGIRHIDLIDLDTIDVSNLNRQFLFRSEHVGQSKAIVAGQAARAFNPDLSITAYHDNIKSRQFNVDYFRSFDVVLNALDNVDARRHVNRLCLAAQVPLIDSGTTGFLGQVTPIVKGITACYECFPKPTQKVYPICTIRSTPDKPVHCIVWAKECFKLLFGARTESMLFEDEQATGEKSTYMHLLTPPPIEETSLVAFLQYARNLLVGLFTLDTQKRIDMDIYKTAKTLPVPLPVEAVDQAVQCLLDRYKGKDCSNAQPFPLSRPPLAPDWDHQVGSTQENLLEWLDCLLEGLWDPSTRNFHAIGQMDFDKDDLWAMRFVAASSNLRAGMFNIPLQSFHDAKGIAGNIIPAIATTNAIIAAVQTQAVLNLLMHLPKTTLFPSTSAMTPDRKAELYGLIKRYAPHTYCARSATRRGHYLEPCAPDEPVASCFVCNAAQVTLQIDLEHATLLDVVNKILKGRMGFVEPSIMVGACTLYEEGEDCEESLRENLSLRLKDCPGGLQSGSILIVGDFQQEVEDVHVVLEHISQEVFQEDEKSQEAVDLFRLIGQPAGNRPEQGGAAVASTAAEKAASEQKEAGDEVKIVDDEDVVIVVEEEGNEREKGGQKRALDGERSVEGESVQSSPRPAKRSRV